MSDAVLGSLIAAGGALLVALIGVVGPRWLTRAQKKADDNERRIRQLEDVNQHLIDNLREDYDRAIKRAVDAERREAEWRTRAVKAERQVTEYLKELP